MTLGLKYISETRDCIQWTYGPPRNTLVRTGSAQGEGGEQGDLLMPALYSLAQHPALQEVQEQLRYGEAIFAYFDDTYITALPDRMRELYEAYKRALWAHSCVELKSPKTRVWNAAGEEPPGLAVLQRDADTAIGWGTGRSRYSSKGSRSVAPLSAATRPCVCGFHRMARSTPAPTNRGHSLSRPMAFGVPFLATAVRWGLDSARATLPTAAQLPTACRKAAVHAVLTCLVGAPRYFSPGWGPCSLCWGWLCFGLLLGVLVATLFWGRAAHVRYGGRRGEAGGAQAARGGPGAWPAMTRGRRHHWRPQTRW